NNVTAVLEELLRELHSLKGDSRMLGVSAAEGIAHKLEEILGEVQQGDRTLSSTDFDRIYPSVDALRNIAREAITGQLCGVDPEAVVAQLLGNGAAAPATPPVAATDANPGANPAAATAFPAEFGDELDADAAELAALLAAVGDSSTEPAMAEPPAPTEAEIAAEVDSDAAELAALLAAAAEQPAPAAPPETLAPPNLLSPPPPSELPEPVAAIREDGATGRIETVRVTADRLDSLAARAGELTVTKLRFERRLQDIDTLLRLWEDWSREAAVSPSYNSRAHLEELGQQVRQLRMEARVDTDRLEEIVFDLEGGIRGLRLLPLETIFNLFPRTVRDLARAQNKDIDLIVEGGDILADKSILEEIKAPLTHLLRNAIDHGIETPDERAANGKPPRATLRMRGARLGNRLALEISDDGRGLDLEAIKETAERRGVSDRATLDAMPISRLQNLIFAPGFSTRTTVTEISGRGVGLDVVRSNIERLKGTIQVTSTRNQGCTFRLSLGTDLSTTTAFIVMVGKHPYAIPVDYVQTACRVRPADMFALEGNPTITLEGQPISVTRLSQLLELPSQESDRALPCVILQVGGERLGILVDELLAQQEVALKPQSKLLQRVRNVAGATILGTGKVCMVLDVPDLLVTARVQSGGTADVPIFADLDTKPTLLLVEDSLPIRTQVRRILEGAGYDVIVAVDGRDGWNKLRTIGQQFAGVVSDVEMPHLSGLELTEQIRQHPEYDELPVILVTTLAKDSDRRRGSEAGANAYLTKGDFDQTLLLNTLRRLI
ncbi:MAG: hybrid sensor histidine kinase/response regulator, partial [Cyanobacteria bacterium J06641_5]